MFSRSIPTSLLACVLLLVVACPDPGDDDTQPNSPTLSPETPTPTPATPTHGPEATPTPKPMLTPTLAPEVTPTPRPMVTPTLAPEATPTPRPMVTPTLAPEATPSPEPAPTPSPEPVATSTPEPAITPTPAPPATPTQSPELTPTPAPTPMPTLAPTPMPTPAPTPTPAVDEDNDSFPAAGDCNDQNAAIYPGADEVCNGLDDDCDGSLDEGVATIWYRDLDADGYGTLTDADGVDTTVESCEVPEGYDDTPGDCDDENPGVNPGALEVCNHIDDDCDGDTDEALETRAYYLDADGDGFGDEGSETLDCGLQEDYVEIAGDCNDEDERVHPGAEEVCNDVDDDCDGETDEGVTTTYYADEDGDGFGNADSPLEGCAPPAGYVVNPDDCDDSAADIVPGANGLCAWGSSCLDILDLGRNQGDGVYVIDPDGPSNGVEPLEAYCDMTTDGGGWTLFYACLETNGRPSEGAVFPGTAHYMPPVSVEALAAVSSQVHFRTAGYPETRSATSVPDSQPIQNLRILMQMNHTYSSSDWTGPFGTDQYLLDSCSTPANYPNHCYWACGNTGGLHVNMSAGQCRWVYVSEAGPNEDMELYVR